MTNTTLARLVEDQFAAAQVLVRSANAPRTSCCGTPIQGTSATRWCGRCGRTFSAADINHETRTPLTPAGGAR